MLYKLIDKNSKATISSALNVFEPPPTNVSLQKSGYREFLTLNPINNPPFHFKITPGSSYLDMSKCSLVTEFRLKKKDDAGLLSNTEEKDLIGVVNNIGNSFIRNVIVTIGGQQVFNANNLYSYKSYLDTELSYNTEAKKNFLSASGYYYNEKDDPEDNKGEAFKKRVKRFAGGKIVQTESKLLVDVFEQDTYFLNNTDIEIIIYPQDGDFLIHAPGYTGKAELEIVSCKLRVKTVDLQTSLALDMEKRLNNTPAQYGYVKAEMKSIALVGGKQEIDHNLFNDQVPRRITVAIVAKDAYNGNIKKDPFNFIHANVEDIYINWNGMRNPAAPYRLDYGKDLYVRAYYDLHEALGYANTNDGIGISYEKYKLGSCFYAFNLTTSLENDNSFDLLKEGNTSLFIKFKEDIPATGYTVIVYGEFDALMFMDKQRNVKSDMTV